MSDPQAMILGGLLFANLALQVVQMRYLYRIRRRLRRQAP
jgi:hypothetical protein